MRFGSIFFIVLVSLIQSNTACAEALRLSARFDAVAATLKLSVKGDTNSRGCVISIFGAESEKVLQREAHKGIRLLSLNVSKRLQTRSVSALSAVLATKGAPIALRAQQVCEGTSRQSPIIRINIGSTSGRSGISKKEFLIEGRQAFLKNGFVLDSVFTEQTFVQPVDFSTSAPDDNEKRIFITEQQGIIRALRSVDGVVSEQTFLDVRDRIVTGGERGLLGLALHPNFAKNGFIFVNFTRKADGATVIARYTASKDGVVDLSTESILLIVAQPFRNHNGGGIAFGPDGFLYIAMGDGGSGGDPQGNGQNKAALLGKILRIDVNNGAPYVIPKTNPFFGNTQGFKEEIWAYGLRNPWRISFDRTRGTLWAADVGQNTLEEIDIIKKGANYGWNTTEGTSCFLSPNCDKTGLTNPVYEYGRNLGRSVTGGYVYRGNAFPNFSGVYFFADFISGRIWGLEKIAGQWVATVMIDSDELISSFGQDKKGELHILSYGSGKIFQIGQRNEG